MMKSKIKQKKLPNKVAIFVLQTRVTKDIFRCCQSFLNHFRDFRGSRNDRSSHQKCSEKKKVLRNFAKFTGKHLYHSLFSHKVAGLRPATLFKKETLAQVFSHEFWEIFKNTYFAEHLWATASKIKSIDYHLKLSIWVGFTAGSKTALSLTATKK